MKFYYNNKQCCSRILIGPFCFILVISKSFKLIAFELPDQNYKNGLWGIWGGGNSLPRSLSRASLTRHQGWTRCYRFRDTGTQPSHLIPFRAWYFSKALNCPIGGAVKRNGCCTYISWENSCGWVCNRFKSSRWHEGGIHQPTKGPIKLKISWF